jgi:PAS domain S-box-containing protein
VGIELTREELEQRVSELETELAACRGLMECQLREMHTAQNYLDVAGVAIVAINARGEVSLINKKGLQILGYGEGEVIGKNWFDCFLPERLREEVRSVFQKLLKGETEPVEYYRNPVLTREGEERLLAWYNTLLKDESGNIVGTLSSGEDVTERVRAEEALCRAHEELATLNRDLEKVVQMRTEELKQMNLQLLEAERLAALGRIANRVAHDIRNPLTVIGGFTRRLHERTPQDAPDRKYIEIILGEVKVLESRVAAIIKMENSNGEWLSSRQTR